MMVTLVASVSPTKVTLQLKWKYQFQFAGFIMAKEKGFYEELGLDVELREFNNSIHVSQELEEGKIDFAVGDSYIIAEVMMGKPLIGMMAVFQQSPFVLIGLSSDIQSLEDIRGKTISLDPNVNGIGIRAMLNSNHINHINVDQDFTLEKLISGEVDLYSGYLSNEPFVLKQLGLDTITFSPKDYGFDGYGDILYTTQKMLKENPEQVEKMYKASLRGWQYAYENPEETIEILYQKYNTLNKSKEALRYEAQTLQKLSGYGTNLGELTLPRIKSIAHIFSFMVQGKYNTNYLNDFIWQPKYPIRPLYTNDYQHKATEMIHQLTSLIEEKKVNTKLVALGLVSNTDMQNAIKYNDPSRINLKKISKDLLENSNFKNVWFQLITKDGISLKRSWTQKRGDSLLESRLDIRK
ncbi:MAG: hypothetical protein DRG30_07640, partial [Epsilonproteobacteria bacterium]